jgi:hypothetical protein
MSARKYAVTGIITFLLVFAGAKSFHFINGTYNSCGYYSFIQPPCSKLPKISSVKAALEKNQEKVSELKKISPAVYVSIQEPCDGKGLIVISHPSEQDCVHLKKVVEGEKFLGFPYKIINQ